MRDMYCILHSYCLIVWYSVGFSSFTTLLFGIESYKKKKFNKDKEPIKTKIMDDWDALIQSLMKLTLITFNVYRLAQINLWVPLSLKSQDSEAT